MSVVLVEEVWNLFSSLWDTRNNILHDENGPLRKSEDSQLLHQLLTSRRYRTRLLAPSNRNIIDYNISEIKKWIRIKKRRTFSILDRCRNQYEKEMQEEMRRQPTLLELGFTRVIPEDLEDITETEPD